MNASALGTNGLPRHAGCLPRCDRYIFVMKSRRERTCSGSFYGSCDRRSRAEEGERPGGYPAASATTPPLRGERLVNNTKRPRRTNIAHGFTGGIPVRCISLYCRMESCFIARTDRRVLHLSPCLSARARREMIGDAGKARDKDQTPAIYPGPLTWSGNFVVGAYRDVLPPTLPLCRFGPSSRLGV